MGAKQRRQHFDGGGFSCAVGAEKGENLALGHVKRHVVDGGEVTELLHELLYTDHRVAILRAIGTAAAMAAALRGRCQLITHGRVQEFRILNGSVQFVNGAFSRSANGPDCGKRKGAASAAPFRDSTEYLDSAYFESWFSPSFFSRSRKRRWSTVGVFGLNATRYQSGWLRSRLSQVRVVASAFG